MIQFLFSLRCYIIPLLQTTLEQVKLFNRADMVIGPHGANLANIMWMRHGAAVVEFMSFKYGVFCSSPGGSITHGVSVPCVPEAFCTINFTLFFRGLIMMK